MRGFLRKLLLFAAFLWAMDKLILLPVRQWSQAPAMETDRRLEWVLTNKIGADVLVLGSSRGARDVYARILSDSLGMPVYNLSYPGADIGFHAFVLDQALAHLRPAPRLVLLVLDDPIALLPDTNTSFRLDRLYPLVRYAPVRRALVDRGEKNWWLSRLLVAHQLTRPVLMPRPKPLNPLDTIQPCGSMILQGRNPAWDPSGAEVAPLPYQEQSEMPEKLRAWMAIREGCARSGVGLALLLPPNYGVPTPGFAERVQALAGSEIPVLRADTMVGRLKEAGYYYDEGHLNGAGAALYTRILAHQVQHRMHQAK